MIDVSSNVIKIFHVHFAKHDFYHAPADNCSLTLEPPREKTNKVVFEQVRHKLGSTSTEDG